MKIALSTVACTDWTMERIVAFAEGAGFEGIEHRTFGHGSTGLVYDPCLVGPAKVRRLTGAHGLENACLATSIRYDEPVFPPVVGRLLQDFERSVKQTKSMVRVAASIECGLVRVFGFELPKGERRASGLRRIRERLELALTTARHTGVKLVLENGGSFPLAEDLAEIIDAISNPLLVAGYNPLAAWAAGEDPAAGVKTLGNRLAIVKLKDAKAGHPVAIGTGEIPLEPMVGELIRRGYRGWATVEFDRLWWPDAGEPEHAVTEGVAAVYRWMGAAQGQRRTAVGV